MVGKKVQKYSNETLKATLDAIQNGLSLRKASTQFSIPKTTLIDHRSNRYKTSNIGAPTVLSADEENVLVDWIMKMGAMGFPVTKLQLIESVGKLNVQLKRKTPFKNGIPGRTWYESFLARHPQIAKRIPQSLTQTRAGITEEAIRSWFSRVQSYLTDNNLTDILNDPRRVFNSDESGFLLAPKDKEVLVKKGSKKVYCRTTNDEKECITVLLTICADGSWQPPLVLFPYKKRVPNGIIHKMPRKWEVGRSESGWMTSENFFEYVTNVFYPWLLENNVPLPIIYYLDGHSSHINLPLTEFCKEKGIILTALLPNSTHRLQPLDVGLFSPLKSAWKNIVREWRMNNNGSKLEREDFSSLIHKCLIETATPKNIQSAFHSCELYPFNPNNIDYSKLVQPLPSAEKIDTNPGTHEPIKFTEFRSMVENNIDPSVLSRFKLCQGLWDGELEYKGLYEFWTNLGTKNVTQLPPESQVENNHDITLENNGIVQNYFITSNASFEVTLDDTIWLENNGIIEAVVEPDGSLSINSKENSKFADTDFQQKNAPSINISAAIDQNTRLRNSEQGENIPLKEISNNNNHFLQKNVFRTNANGNDNACLSNSEKLQTIPHQEVNDEIVTSLGSEKHLVEETTPIKQNINSEYPTPFKHALYWPQSQNKVKRKITDSTGTTKLPKLQPTVAISDDFLEYQRRVQEEKAKKEEDKKKREEIRKHKALEKNKISEPKPRKREKTIRIPSKPKGATENNASCTNAECTTQEFDHPQNHPYLPGDYVIVKYDNYYPGKVVEILTDEINIKTMVDSGSHWKWPEREDILHYFRSDIMCQIKAPVLINKRGAYSVPEITEWVM